MATKKQKEELIQTLKFTPCTYTLMISGYGGESYAGRVSKETYEYFKEKQIDIEEYACDWNDRFNDVPRELQPFSPGSPYDCDELFHLSGAELSSLNEIQVRNEHNEDHWSCAAGINQLEDAGVTVNENGAFDFDDDLKPGEYAFWGGQGEKGCFFEGELDLTSPFDPAKLVIGYENCDGWWLIGSVEYDGVEIDGSNGYGTTGKWTENKWILPEGEEPYETVSREDQEEEDNEEESIEWPEPELAGSNEEDIPAMPELPLTDWYPVAVKPVRKGMYEVRNTHTPVWPFPATFIAYWTGCTWKDSDNSKIPNIIDWRGLAVDPTVSLFDCECVQCDWKGSVDECNDWNGQMCCPECGEPVEFL